MQHSGAIRRRLSASVGLLALATLLWGCSSGLTIDRDYDESVNFSQLNSWRWMDTESDRHQDQDYHGNDILDGRIRQAVERELAAKGFRQQAQGEVDFLVNYSVTKEDKTEIRSYNTYGGLTPGFAFGYGHGFYRYGYSVMYHPEPEVRTVHYQEGTLVLDVINPQEKLIWRGSAEGRLKKNQTVEEKREAVNSVVAKVLAGFPPPRESMD